LVFLGDRFTDVFVEATLVVALPHNLNATNPRTLAVIASARKRIAASSLER
jgi:hypothetical protein